nr:MAG: hypothetical protein DIU57_19050 [Pseudomonadota bacterium]
MSVSPASEKASFSAEMVAFTFSPANDSTPDPMVRKLKDQGLGRLGQTDDRDNNAFDAPYRMLSLASSLFLEGLLRWPFLPGFGATKEPFEPRR